MDIHKDSLQFARLEVVDSGRRWSEAEKERIVAESCAGHGQAAATARRYGISRSLLAKWRKQFDVKRSSVVASPPAVETAAERSKASGQLVEVGLPNELRLLISPDIEPRYLRQIVKALG